MSDLRFWDSEAPKHGPHVIPIGNAGRAFWKYEAPYERDADGFFTVTRALHSAEAVGRPSTVAQFSNYLDALEHRNRFIPEPEWVTWQAKR